jgi:hypothetical protein
MEITLKPALYPKQREAIFDNNRISCIEAGTKCGKTLSCLHWLIFQAGKHGNGANHWWVAPVYPQAEIAYKRLKLGLKPFINLGFKFNESDLTITFPNGALIVCKSGEKPDNLYGEDVFSAVLDEASRLRKESFYAVRSTLTATKGPMRLIGNVRGRANYFFEMCRRIEQGKLSNASHYILVAQDAVDAGVLDKNEILEAKELLPEAVFNELYNCVPSDDGSNPFGIQHIQDCIIPNLTHNKVEIWGLDLAKSKDYAVLLGLDKDNCTSEFYRWQESWEFTEEKVKSIVTDGTKIVCDATGVGDPVVEHFQKAGLNLDGFKFTSISKQQLMENLAILIQNHSIHFPDGVIVEELESFEYGATRTGVRYSAPDGYFDDTVCALALAGRNLPTIVGQDLTSIPTDRLQIRESISSWDGTSSLFSENEYRDLLVMTKDKMYE